MIGPPRVAVGDVVVRPATAADIDDVTAIERDAFSQPWSRDSFADLVRAREAVFLVAIASDRSVAGYAILLVAAGHSELANLAVTRTARGQGVGRRLVAEAIAHARAHEATEMFLEVRESNRAAQTLYASAGFQSVARRRHYYEQPMEDALVLRLQIDRQE